MNILRRAYCRAFQTVFRIALPLLPYREPVPLEGLGAITPLLKEKKVSAVLLVTDRSVRGLGLTAPLEEDLKAAGISCAVYDGTVPNPTIQNVEEGRRLYLETGAGAIIAVGGGSVMDCAKGVGARIARPGKSVRKMRGLLKVLLPTPLTIAVPTTAGTGSETTVAAIISDSATHSKKQLLDPKLVPMFAILDPELTVGLPKHTTAHTALDALTHALEAYVAGYADEETDRQARIAVRLIFQYLPKVQEDPTDLEGREALLTASFFAGMAFTRTYVGYVHAFAHTIGGKFGVSHGLANAVLLPHIMRYYLPVCYKRFAELGRMLKLGMPGDSDQIKATRFVKLLYKLNRQMGIPTRFEKFPASAIEEVIDMAFQECHGTYPVPRYFTREHARKLMEAVCAKEEA